VPDIEIPGKSTAFLTDGNAEVWLERDGAPVLTCNAFGKGFGIYLAGYRHNAPNARLLLNVLHAAAGLAAKIPNRQLTPDDPYVECAWYPEDRTLALVNNDGKPRKGTVWVGEREVAFSLEAYEMKIIK